jgi:hypothetical protein
VEFANFVQRLTEKPGDRSQFLIGHPNVSGRTCATFPTLGTRECQPVLIPRFIFFMLTLAHGTPSQWQSLKLS